MQVITAMTKTKVHCNLRDCVYYNVPEALGERQRGLCDCGHPEKHDYMQAAVCPLYKKNWNNMPAADVNRFKRRHLKR